MLVEKEIFSKEEFLEMVRVVDREMKKSRIEGVETNHGCYPNSNRGRRLGAS